MQPEQAWINIACKRKGIIAGGCLRDLITGRMPPKDVDIFVPGLTEEDGQDQYMAGFKVENLLLNGVKYQIIKHRFGKGRAFLEHFDLGLCKVSFDPYASWDKNWYFSPEFVRDLGQRTITVLRKEGFNFEDHLARVVAKYPEFEVVDNCETLEELF